MPLKKETKPNLTSSQLSQVINIALIIADLFQHLPDSLQVHPQIDFGGCVWPHKYKLLI